uniref:Histone H2A n=1 Tax=Caenorhabditis japonica TaxID=281687 RepID=A0A8R1E7N6_CAEJA
MPSKTSKAGLVIGVGRVNRKLRKQLIKQRITAGAPVFLSAVLEYLVVELLEIAGDVATKNKKKRITPRHLQIAVRNDEELDKLLAGVTIAQGGVIPGHAAQGDR